MPRSALLSLATIIVASCTSGDQLPERSYGGSFEVRLGGLDEMVFADSSLATITDSVDFAWSQCCGPGDSYGFVLTQRASEGVYVIETGAGDPDEGHEAIFVTLDVSDYSQPGVTYLGLLHVSWRGDYDPATDTQATYEQIFTSCTIELSDDPRAGSFVCTGETVAAGGEWRADGSPD